MTLGELDPDNTNLIHFNVENYKSRLPHQLAFQITTRVVGRKVHRTVLNEGYSTSFLSMYWWKSIGSLDLNKSPTTLTYFYRQGFKPHGLLLALSIKLWEKCLYPSRSGWCPSWLQFFIRKELVLCYDRRCLVSFSWTLVPASRKNCDHRPTRLLLTRYYCFHDK